MIRRLACVLLLLVAWPAAGSAGSVLWRIPNTASRACVRLSVAGAGRPRQGTDARVIRYG